MEERAVKIAFDKDYQIRVLDPATFSKAESLEKEASLFVESTYS